MIQDNKNLKLENTYCELPNIFYSKEIPEKILNPKLVEFNKELAEDLGLDLKFLNSDEGIQYLVELKIWRGEEYHKKGLKQLSDYLEINELDCGYLIIYNLF